MKSFNQHSPFYPNTLLEIQFQLGDRMRCHRYAVGVAAMGFVFIVAASSVDAQRRTPRELVQRALDALGGTSAARSVNNLTYDYVSVTYQLGQEETPLSPPRGTILNGRIVADFANGRRLQEQELRPGVPPPPGNPPVTVTRQRRITLQSGGMLETNSQQSPEPALQLPASQQALRFIPHRILLAALDRPGALTAAAPRAFRGDTLDGVRYAAGPDTAMLYFDRFSGSLFAIETITDDPVLGDRRRATIFTRWTPAGAIKFPRQIDVEVNGRAAEHMNVVAASTNDAITDAMFAIPDSITARAAASTGPAPIAVTLVDLGSGVWRAEGGSHHTLVVEQPNGLIVVETPQNRARMSAVFDTLRSRFPNKRVLQAVNTHHHWDHSGGLRETMARGVAIVTHVRNVSFVRGVAFAPKTVAPDILSRVRPAPAIRAVRDSLTIGTGTGRIVVYALPTAHVEGMLAAYVPSVGVLFTSDVLSPGAPNAPLAALGSRELDTFAKSRGITPRRYAGGHGRIAEWSEVQRAAQ